MITIDVADLVVIAGRVLGIGPAAALDQLDLAAAQAALAEAKPPEAELIRDRRADRDRADRDRAS